jgi:large subunit ribosomal protein L10
MTREEKSIAIEDLTAQLAGTNIVYVADISGLNADTSKLRRACLKQVLEVVKTLLVKAMEASGNDYGELPSVLTGNSAIFISEVANGPKK